MENGRAYPHPGPAKTREPVRVLEPSARNFLQHLGGVSAHRYIGNPVGTSRTMRENVASGQPVMTCSEQAPAPGYEVLV